MKLAVSESFYSLQGEGKTTGFPAVFLRLAGCNLLCGGAGTQFDKELHNGATWRCDTIEVWMKGKAVNFEDVLDENCIEALRNGAHLIITGGEPLMHQEQLVKYIEYLRAELGRVYIEIETNGTITPSDALDAYISQYNVSPKLSNSGNVLEQRFNETALKALADKPNAIFKFVVSDIKDWEEIKEKFLPIIPRHQVWLMPAGENQDLLQQTKNLVAELCKEHYLKFTTRLHIDLWNQKTGV